LKKKITKITNKTNNNNNNKKGPVRIQKTNEKTCSSFSKEKSEKKVHRSLRTPPPATYPAPLERTH